jgi:hypothetical protein
MRSHTYSKFSPELADAIDLQSLLDKLADFLLQSGFAGGSDPSHFGFDFGDESDRSLDALRQAIIDALMASNQFTPEMLQALRGEGTPEAQAQLATSSATRRCATSSARSGSRRSAATTRRTSRPASRRMAGANSTSSATS